MQAKIAMQVACHAMDAIEAATSAISRCNFTSRPRMPTYR